MSSNIYRNQDSPRFILGHSVELCYLVVFLFGGSLATTIYLRTENKKRLHGQRNSWVENKTDAEIADLGDRRYGPIILYESTKANTLRPDFTYII